MLDESFKMKCMPCASNYFFLISSSSFLFHFTSNLQFDTNDQLLTRLFDKRDNFNFAIMKCPYLNCNIPPAPSYWVYILQYVRRACSLHLNFLQRYRLLSIKLLNQGFLKNSIILSFNKYFRRYQLVVFCCLRTKNQIKSNNVYWSKNPSKGSSSIQNITNTTKTTLSTQYLIT